MSTTAFVFYVLCIPMVVTCLVVAVIGHREDRARLLAGDARLARRREQAVSDLERFAGGAR